MNRLRITFSVMLLGGCATLAAWAQDDAAPQETPQEAPAEEAQESREATPAGPIPDDNPLPPASDDEFIPTEELQADEEVTFPVDI